MTNDNAYHNTPHNAHDNSYKLLFSHPEMVSDLLTGYIKEPWVEQLDLSTLETVSGSYTSDDLRDREDDIIWRVRWKSSVETSKISQAEQKQSNEGWLYIYLLLEFQSSVDRYMPLRLNIYSSLLMDDLRKTKRLTPNGKLPPVFPLVLYNGERNWTAPLELNELIENVPGGLHLYQPHFRYCLLDEKHYQDESLPEVKNLVSALFALENSRTPADMQRILTALIEWLKQPEQTGLRRNFTLWLKRVLLPARVPGVQFEQIHNLHEVHSMLAERVKTWTEEWKQEGIQQGVQEGIEQEREQERQRKAVTVQKLLTRRFGLLSEENIQRLNQATAEELDQWTEAIFDIESLEEVFGKQ
ncbi:Rpn family recombination-promoting nuclease/putative transposase [Oceanospirillum beijerinckii]|uniref:Rpn family recombination-promoting nuclease/putative transposase n=1 Tax=Oceanospirillum beijerinckii TaxID=64976 RepID=UPI0003F75991|nr:Rpn family recombination-promoting nuclease/putative transposase [Oceanospirillum beijerinckii]